MTRNYADSLRIFIKRGLDSIYHQNFYRSSRCENCDNEFISIIVEYFATFAERPLDKSCLKNQYLKNTQKKTVSKIFALCVEGYGPTKIANILTKEKIPTPSEYWASQGIKCCNLPSVCGRWVQTCVADILEKQEYVGDTVNFRTTRKSFKNKEKVMRPAEEWKIFENTHPAIIDRETFALVGELRKNKRRPTREGKISMFSGLLFCHDCGEKMYYCTAKKFTHDQNWFTCSTARKNKGACLGHFIREVVRRKSGLGKYEARFLVRPML